MGTERGVLNTGVYWGGKGEGQWEGLCVMCHGLGVEQFLQEQAADEEEMKAPLSQKQNKFTQNVN